MVELRVVPEITLELCKKISEHAEQKAKEMGLKVVIAIMDNHGNLKYFSRMDGVQTASVEIAQLKARTSALFPISSKDLALRNEKLQPNGPFSSVPGIVLLEGGLPIKTGKSSTHIGGIGVSGARSDEDAIIGAAGLEAVKGDLEPY